MSMYKNIFVDEALETKEAGEQVIDLNGNVRVYGESAFSSLDEAVEGLQGGALICVVQSGKYTYYTVNDARELSVAQQVVYVNFNGGENLSYDNAAGYSVSDVDIAPAAYTAEQKSYVIQTLNANASDGVVYVDETPAGGDFSTVHVGSTDSFDALGSFKGISETIDAGNLVKNDEAFVNTDNITDIADLVNTIEHETGHLTGEAHDTMTGTVNDYALTADGKVDIIRDGKVIGTYDSIQAAVTAAASGDIIAIGKGAFSEGTSAISLDKALSFVGCGSDSKLNIAFQVNSSANGSSFSNLELIYSGNTILGESCCLYFNNNAANITVSNVSFVDNIYDPSKTPPWGTHKGVITSSNGNSGIKITGSTFTGFESAVYINPNATSITITGNTVDACKYGIRLNGGNNIDLSGNSFINGSGGFQIRSASWFFASGTPSANVNLSGNTFTGDFTNWIGRFDIYKGTTGVKGGLLDLSSCEFNGKTFANMTLDEQAAAMNSIINGRFEVAYTHDGEGNPVSGYDIISKTINVNAANSNAVEVVDGALVFKPTTSAIAAAAASNGSIITIEAGKYVGYADLNAVATDITVKAGAEIASNDANMGTFELGGGSTITNNGTIGLVSGETWTSVGGVISSGSLNLVNKASGTIYATETAVQGTVLDVTNDGLIDGGIYASSGVTLKGSGVIKGGITAKDETTPTNAYITFASGSMSVSGDVTSTGSLNFAGATVTLGAASTIAAESVNITIDTAALGNSAFSYKLANISQAQADAIFAKTITLECGELSATMSDVHTFTITSGGKNYYFTLDYTDGALTVKSVAPVVEADNPVQISNAWTGMADGVFVKAGDNYYIIGKNAFAAIDKAVTARPSDISDISVQGMASVNASYTLANTTSNTLNLVSGAFITIGKDANGNLYSFTNLDSITGSGKIVLDKKDADVTAWLNGAVKADGVTIVAANTAATPDADNNVKVITGEQAVTGSEVVSTSISTTGNVTLEINDAKNLVVAGNISGDKVTITNSQDKIVAVGGNINASNVTIETTGSTTGGTINLGGTIQATTDVVIKNAANGTINGGISDGMENAANINAAGDVIVTNNGHLNANITATGGLTIKANTSRRTTIGSFTGSHVEVFDNVGVIGDVTGAQATSFTATASSGYITIQNNHDAGFLPGLVINTTFTAPGEITLEGGEFINIKAVSDSAISIIDADKVTDTAYAYPVTIYGDSSAPTLTLEANTVASQDIAIIHAAAGDTFLADSAMQVNATGTGVTNLILKGYQGTVGAGIEGIGTLSLIDGTTIDMESYSLSANTLNVEAGATLAFDAANQISAMNAALDARTALTGAGTVTFTGKDVTAPLDGYKGFSLGDDANTGFDVTGFSGTAKVMADSVLQLNFEKDYFGNAATVDVASTGVLELNKGGEAAMKFTGAGQIDVNKTASFSNDNSGFTGKVVLGDAANLAIGKTGSSSTTALLGASEIDMTRTGANVLDLTTDQLFAGSVNGTADDTVNVKANVELSGDNSTFAGLANVNESGANLTLSNTNGIAAKAIDLGDNTNANTVTFTAAQTSASEIKGGTSDKVTATAAVSLTGTVSGFAGDLTASASGASFVIAKEIAAANLDMGDATNANSVTLTASQTYAGAIKGGDNDSLNVLGALKLTGANTAFTGAANVNTTGASLNLGSAIAAKEINLGSDTAANSLTFSAAQTYAGQVKGTAQDSVSVESAVVLTGDNSTFAGAATISAAGATLELKNAFGAASINLGNDATANTLTLNSADATYTLFGLTFYK